ncbi:MAG: hypothetical protein IJK42_02945 [Prevotella sp.]|nr:hypothetical protein [Prevotella sp.]
MKHFKLLFASLALFGAVSANAQTDVTETYIQNADMSSTDGWTAVISGQFRDYGNGLIGSWTNYTAPATVDETHLDTEYCFGLECRWSGNYASYTQTTEELPAGVYTLTFDVENVNGSTQNKSWENRFFVQVGENKITDTATEWMKAKSSWTTHTINFTLDEPAAVTISLGYGTGSNNIGSANTPSLYVSHLTLTYQSLLDGVKALWEEALAAAQDAYGNPEYSNVSGEENDALYAEINKEEPTTQEGYEEATAALQEATATFIAAKDAYDTWVNVSSEEYPELAYADPDKRTALEEACEPIPTSAADAQEKTAAIYTALRAYYESNALAEGVDGAVVMDDVIANPKAENGNNDWTWTGNKNNPASNEPWTDADGNSEHKYFDGGNWNGSSWTTTMKQTISLPAGRYLLTAKGRAAVNTTLTMAVGENSVELPHVGNTGNVFDRGWGDASVEFETNGEDVEILVTATSSTIHEWFSISDFRLVQLEEIEVPMADDDDYAALLEVASYYMDAVLGFDVDEYAPYNNIDAVLLSEEVGNLDGEKIQNHEYTKEYIQGLTAALQALVVTPNEEELNAVYDGDFAIQEAHESGDNVVLPGWTTVSGNTRLILKDTEAYPAVADADAGAALFVHPGTYEYGHTLGYTMPLDGGEMYILTLKYCAWQNGSNNNLTATILDEEGNTVASQAFGKVQGGLNAAGSLKAVKMYFTPEEDGDFILSINANGNTAFTDVKIVKAVLTDLVLNSTDTAAPEEQFAGTVTTDRILLEGLNTIVLPFETTKEEIGAATVLEYTGTTVEADGTITLNFTETESLSANVPYAVMMAADAAEPLAFEMKEVTPAEDLTVADDNFTFVGTYTDIAKGNDVVKSGDYVAGATAFKKAKGGNRLAAYRAYMKKEAAAEGAKIAFNFDGNIVDGIAAVELMNNINEGIYNLNGQRIEKAQKGVNIVNGKKVLVK